MSNWFYWSDGSADWHGRNELARRSTWVNRQRYFSLFGRRFFYGTAEVDLEIIWEVREPALYGLPT